MTERLSAGAPTADPPRRRGRRVVVTGLGPVTPIGATAEDLWRSLLEGRSGVRPITLFDAAKLPVRIAGEVPDFSGKDHVDKKDRKHLRVMARAIQLAVAAAQVAMLDCGLQPGQLDPTRFGVEFGSGLMATELDELAAAASLCADHERHHVDLARWGTEGMGSIQPLWMLKYLPNMLACHVSVFHNAQGPNNTIIQSDLSSLLAVGEAYRILQRDHADFCLAGGADSKINPLSMVRQCLFAHLSRRNDQPERACRPFERWRDGVVIGEGGAVLALEELEHARRRGAKVYAELAGFGSAFDQDRSGAGIARAARAALADAGIGAAQVGFVCAHGLGTVPMDVREARGIRQAFEGEPVPVFAPKSYFGNMGAAAGSAELLAGVLALHKGQVPATLNYEEPDPECPLAVTRQPVACPKPYFLKVGFTDMGHCAALVVRRWD